MSYQDLVPGQEDWVNEINTNFHSLAIKDTGAVYNSVQGLNGFHGTNMVYREVTLPSGLKQIFFGGWEDAMPKVPKNSAVEAYKLPINWPTAGYYINVSQVTDRDGNKVMRHRLKLNPNNGIVAFTNVYDYDVSDFNCGMGLVLTQMAK